MRNKLKGNDINLLTRAYYNTYKVHNCVIHVYLIYGIVNLDMHAFNVNILSLPPVSLPVVLSEIKNLNSIRIPLWDQHKDCFTSQSDRGPFSFLTKLPHPSGWQLVEIFFHGFFFYLNVTFFMNFSLINTRFYCYSRGFQ